MALTKTRRAELEAELLKTLDRLDALKLEELEARREHREQLSLNQKKVLEIRGILSGREAEQTSIPGTETGEVKPRKVAPKAAARQVVTKVHRARGPVTVWVADKGATRVPTFVIEQTGLKKKAQIVAKYGENARFEAGRPSPKPATPRPDDPKPTRTRKATEGAAIDAKTGLPEHGPAGACCPKTGKDWRECPTCVAEVSRAKSVDELPRATPEEIAQEPCLSCGVPAGEPSEGCEDCLHGRPAEVEAAAPAEIPWTEDDGRQEVLVGSTTWRLIEVTPIRWVLESKSQRERAWHKEGVFESQAKAEEVVRSRSGKVSIDALVGSREDAVRRHAAAGKAVAG